MGWGIQFRLRRSRFEAVALPWQAGEGAAIRGQEWVAGVSEGRAVKVSVARVAAGGDSAGEDSGDIGDGSGEIGARKRS
jgi:hypothetical protein